MLQVVRGYWSVFKLKDKLTTIYVLTKRNVKCFTRDRASVFFSFLSPIILLFLYLFFLADVQVMNIESTLKAIPNFVYSSKDIKIFVNSWLVANVISVGTITITLGVSGNIVGDKQLGIINDFTVAPVSKIELVISYFLSIFIVSFTINFLLLIMGQLLIVFMGGSLMALQDFFYFLGMIILSLISVVFLIMFIVSFLNTANSYSALSSIIGTFAGFMIGAYLPISMFPKWLQFISNLIPSSLSSSIFRNILMKGPLEKLLYDIPEPILETVKGKFRYNFSLDLFYFDFKIENSLMLIIIVGSGILFLLINIFRYRKV